MTRPSGAENRSLTPVLFLTLLPLAFHLLFSHLGFNPTDDGFVLAYGRRILMGQMAHRDFITIRPAGSALLHLPIVLMGSDYTFWLSRLLVWFQFAAISWAWVIIVERLLRISFRDGERLVLALIAFAFSVHTFPIMAWHTIDGLFWISLGLALCLKAPPQINVRGRAVDTKLLGYALVGMAYLAKQNFLPVAFVSVLLLGDWRRSRYWLAAATPGILYVGYLLLGGAVADAIRQLGSQTGLVSVGVDRYTNRVVLVSGFAGLAAVALLFTAIDYKMYAGKVVRLLGTLLIFGGLGYVATALRQGGLAYYGDTPSFVLFGMAGGGVVFFLVRPRWIDHLRVGVLTMFVAWSASLSVGYNTPALATGPLAIVLIGYVYTAFRPINNNDWTRTIPVVAAVLLAALSVANLRAAREQFIYRDRPVGAMTRSLDGVFPGANLIRTNEHTYEFLVDLRRAVRKAGGKKYAIIPDLAAWWVRAPDENPLPIDWPQGTELAGEGLLERVTDALDANRGNMVVIVQKVSAGSLAGGFKPLPENHYAVVRYVQSRFEKVDETRYFTLYE